MNFSWASRFAGNISGAVSLQDFLAHCQSHSLPAPVFHCLYMRPPILEWSWPAWDCFWQLFLLLLPCWLPSCTRQGKGYRHFHFFVAVFFIVVWWACVIYPFQFQDYPLKNSWSLLPLAIQSTLEEYWYYSRWMSQHWWGSLVQCSGIFWIPDGIHHCDRDYGLLGHGHILVVAQKVQSERSLIDAGWKRYQNTGRYWIAG